ncbi:hypothetical protein HJC23_002644 [Cyclotella cryptica]|uniref:Transmembrane protein n=1 Tax=Cyclotella cryptica TaxID=29204 RepID=A0ABD3PL09_9STRA
MAELLNSTQNSSTNVPCDENPSVLGNMAQNEASGRRTPSGASRLPSKATTIWALVLNAMAVVIIVTGTKVTGTKSFRSNSNTHKYNREFPSDLDVAFPPPRRTRSPVTSSPPRIRRSKPPSTTPVNRPIVSPPLIIPPPLVSNPNVFGDPSFSRPGIIQTPSFTGSTADEFTNPFFPSSRPGIIQTPSFTGSTTDEFINPFSPSSDDDGGVSSMSMRMTNDIISAPEVDYYDDDDLGSR